MMHLKLYSSKACCLCDDAMDLIQGLAPRYDIRVKKIDIYLDKSLLIKYKTSIPVLSHESSNKELAWPFNREVLEDWLLSL